MSGLGPEWREVSYVEYRDDGVPPARTATVRVGDEDPHYFIRDEPLPELPTEAYTVIRAEWRKGGHTFLVLTPVGWQDIDGNALRPGSEADLAGSVTSFEVLAEPRAAAVKAVFAAAGGWLSVKQQEEIIAEMGVEL